MSLRRVLFAIASSALLAACSDGVLEAAHAEPPAVREPTSAVRPAAAPPAAETAADGTCGAICANTRALVCGSELACLATCAEMRTSTACHAELESFLTCASARDSSDWECDDGAMPALRSQVCHGEQAAVAGCLERLGR
jgi:hypothetical protein